MDSATTIITTDPPTSAFTTAVADRCANCGAPLASDQRYCLECGERRGDPRLPIMSGRLPEPEVAPPPPPRSRLPRSTASTTLIAGIGTLLLAMGVGVLIGRSGDHTPAAKNQPVQVVTLGGGAAGAATAASSSTPGATAAAATAGGAKAASKSSKSKSAAKSSSSSSVAKKPGKVVTLGQKGSGKGYKNGKFTGDFFGN
jgi:hypothetical protein